MLESKRRSGREGEAPAGPSIPHSSAREDCAGPVGKVGSAGASPSRPRPRGAVIMPKPPKSSPKAPPPPPATQPDLSGKRLGDFQVLRKLGQGGMGQVYLAEQISLKRKVALKVLRP